MDWKPYSHRPKYYETDQMAVIHHSNYIRWFEDARIDWLRQIGIQYDEMEKRGVIIPVVSASAEYKNMTHLLEDVLIYCRLDKFNSVRFIVSYEVRSAETGELKCIGSTQHCFIDKDYRPAVLKKLAPDYDAAFRAALNSEGNHF